MKINKILNVTKRFLFKNSPYILSGIGAASVATGAVILVKKAKNQSNFDEKINEKYVEKRQVIEVYDDKNKKKEIVKLNVWRAGKYVRYYTLPTILISGGVMCMVSALLIQTKRLKALSVAYTSLATAFNDYRERVKEKVGDKDEEELFTGVKRDKNGKAIESIKRNGIENETVFSRLFGEGNSYLWVKDTRLCVLTLKAAESNLNERLRADGFVTLNDFWEELGFKPSSEGMYLGWRFKQGDPVYGNTYINIGFSGPKNEEKCNILRNCWDEEIWIDIIPPHILIDKLPKERIRTEAEKKMIKENRKRIPTTTVDSDSRYTSEYEMQKALTNRLNKNYKRTATIV